MNEEPLFSMINKSEVIHLHSPESFEGWERSFKMKVKDYGLNDLIFNGEDPMSPPNLPPIPEMPDPPEVTSNTSLPPAESTQSSTPQGSSTSHIPSTERFKKWEIQVQLFNIKMTTYNTKKHKYNTKMNLYKKQEKAIHTVCQWVDETVSKDLKKTCCLTEDTLVKWFKKLEKRAQKENRTLKTELANAFKSLVKPTRTPPQSWYEWMNEFEAVLIDMEMKNMSEMNDSKYWF